MKKNLISRSLLVTSILLLAIASSACGNGSVVSDSKTSAGSSTAQPASAQPQTTPSQTENAQVTAQPQQPTPSPTMHPIMKQAQAKPGVPVPVPESMKRPFNAEEMKKALEAMPPEVRARIQGMQAAPQGVKPQATPKQ
ncbi:MAG: hypothetical protein AB7P14_16305 [Blastocatellales bacterium]